MDDIAIMPIEEITPIHGVNVTSLQLEREDYWCRELCTYYLYGLNDNVRGVANISGLVVNELFNRRGRKFRKRSGYRRRRKFHINDLTSRLENCLHVYKSLFFVFNVRYLVLSLPVKWMVLWNIFHCWKQMHDVPDRILILMKDLIAFRKKGVHIGEGNIEKGSRDTSGYMSIIYYNKGIDMVNFPRILNSKFVRDAVPSMVKNGTPPTVSFKYTKTIGGKISNQKQVVQDLDINVGVSNILCNCHNNKYCYGPVGHVVTGDLYGRPNVIKDVKL